MDAITSLDFVFKKTLLLYYKCVWGGTQSEHNDDISKDKLGVICKALLAGIEAEGEETEDGDSVPGSGPVGGKGMPVSPKKYSAATALPKMCHTFSKGTLPEPAKLGTDSKKTKCVG